MADTHRPEDLNKVLILVTVEREVQAREGEIEWDFDDDQHALPSEKRIIRPSQAAKDVLKLMRMLPQTNSIPFTSGGVEHELLMVPCLQRRSEEVIVRLMERGIGSETGRGTVHVVNSEFTRGGPKLAPLPQDPARNHGRASEPGGGGGHENPLSPYRAFMDSVKSRILVQQIKRKIEGGFEFTFDFLMLCVVAAMIACIGLATNNDVIIVASMLVSPLMGPIMAITFGTVIADKIFILEGLKTELVALLLCLVASCLPPQPQD